ncbi:MAG: choice-of-anchor C family protein [Gammaproteobacteria bacterium]|nr:choice-of-anchor C family protein [Gammaproteobacteria bacterium]
MNNRRFAVLVCALCTLQLPTMALANLITNHSFEAGPAVPGGQSFVTVGGGSTAITGWLVTGSTIDVVEPGWNVSDGNRAIDLDGAFSIGGIQQTISTITGATYDVTFDLSGNPGFPGQAAGPQVKNVRVAIDSFTQDYQFDTQGLTPATLTWQPNSFSFTASGDSATLSFASLSPGNNSWGAMIDNVSVTQRSNGGTGTAPTPAVAGLLVAGLACFGLVRRRSRAYSIGD